MIIITAALLVQREKERKKEYINERLASVVRRLTILTTGNDTAIKVSFRKPVFSLRRQVFWVVTPYGWVNFFPTFRKKYYLHLQSYGVTYL